MKTTFGCSSRERAFTMVEIALSLAIIGLGMIAIIGVLPRGLDVQRENRDETIINQDANVWLNAIRSGARGCDDLTNYVDAITKVVSAYDINGDLLTGYPEVHLLTPTNYFINGTPQPPLYPNNFFNGTNIIGLLSTPKLAYHDLPNRIIAVSNYVAAYVRAMSGAAVEKSPQTNANVREMAFSYRMVSEVSPYAGWDTNMVQYPVAGLTADEIAARSNYWMVARSTHPNLHEIRLLFRWPLLPRGRTGDGRQVFRAAVAGQLAATNEFGQSLYFFQPRTYVRNP